MFCSKCGAEIKEGMNFCNKCGHPTGSIEQAPTPESIVEGQGKEKKSLKLLVIILAIVCVVAGVAVGGLWLWKYSVFQGNLSKGADYIKEEEYEEALNAYLAALEYDPENVDAMLGMAQAYVCEGKYRQAKRQLKDVRLEEGDERESLYSILYDIANFEPAITGIDVSGFPNVKISFSQGSETVLTNDNFSLVENGAERKILSVEQNGEETQLTYQSEDTNVNEEARSFVMEITVHDTPFVQEGNYVTPYFEEAKVTLVSTDVSQYPLVKAYVKITDDMTGENISNLATEYFTISERLQGGEYLNREVKAASLLKDNEGLNINLIADKSDSIYSFDMDKIKNVMIQFVSSLHYDIGDRAEVLAFDSIVQQMCYYTDDVNLLINGINNMSTDGLTAFYDAVYDGITHAALQGGARCVIAFTDGMDNQSIHSAYEVIAYACEKQVPVYVIGVGGSVEEYTLEEIAYSTGGRYWYIDDLYDLEEIFSQVYSEQKDIYVVEYESDAALDTYLTRDLKINMSGNGYRGVMEDSITPVRSINDNGGVEHTSRYEIFKECLTWEEASARCQEMGGHLATITSQDEMNELIAIAEAAEARYVWLGGYTSYDDDGNVFGHWVTGEPFAYQSWCVDEPSRVDKDGVEEWYIMLWNIPSLGGWSWNDQRNDPAGAVKSMVDEMAFICEFEN